MFMWDSYTSDLTENEIWKARGMHYFSCALSLIIVTIISTTFYNFTKQKTLSSYKNIINNIYLKKTTEHLFNNLEPKFKKINHKVLPGETFDNILTNYSVKKTEISEIKKKYIQKNRS